MNSEKEITFSGGWVRDKGGGGGVRTDAIRPERLARPDPTTVQEASLALAGGKTSAGGKSPLKVRKVRLACLGIPSHILEQGSEEYAKCIRQANSYKKQRVKEFFEAHGYVSSGVHALLASAALAIGASRFIYATAAVGAADSLQVMKLASSLSDSARQNELSAWELCARESIVKKRNNEGSKDLPWLVVPQHTVTPDGLIKRGRGRPRKANTEVPNAIVISEETNDA